MHNEREHARGFPLGGWKGGSSDVSPLSQRGSPSACWGVGISGCNWRSEGASRLQRSSRRHNLKQTPTWYTRTTLERQSLSGSTAVGRGFMT